MNDWEYAECPVCGDSMAKHVTCWDCGGDGGWWGYDDDPLWYDPDDFELCLTCKGVGYYEVCPTCSEEPEMNDQEKQLRRLERQIMALKTINQHLILTLCNSGLFMPGTMTRKTLEDCQDWLEQLKPSHETKRVD